MSDSVRYRVINRSAAKAKVSIAFSLENPIGTEGRTNDYQESGDLHGLLMRNLFLAATDPFAGTFALSMLGDGKGKLSYGRGWASANWWQGPLLLWEDFSADGELGGGPGAQRFSLSRWREERRYSTSDKSGEVLLFLVDGHGLGDIRTYGAAWRDEGFPRGGAW